MPAGQRRFFVNRIVDLDSALIHEPVLAGSDWLIPALTGSSRDRRLPLFVLPASISLIRSLSLSDGCL